MPPQARQIESRAGSQEDGDAYGSGFTGGDWCLGDGSVSHGGTLNIDGGTLNMGNGSGGGTRLNMDNESIYYAANIYTDVGGTPYATQAWVGTQGYLTSLQGNATGTIDMVGNALNIWMEGGPLNMNTGGGSGGGTLNMDGGAICGSAASSGQPGGTWRLGDGSGSHGGTLDLEGW